MNTHARYLYRWSVFIPKFNINIDVDFFVHRALTFIRCLKYYEKRQILNGIITFIYIANFDYECEKQCKILLGKLLMKITTEKQMIFILEYRLLSTACEFFPTALLFPIAFIYTFIYESYSISICDERERHFMPEYLSLFLFYCFMTKSDSIRCRNRTNSSIYEHIVMRSTSCKVASCLFEC